MHIRPYEIVFIGLFAVLGIAGIFVLSNYKNNESPEERKYGESIVIWGTFDRSIIELTLQELKNVDKAFEVVSYTQFDARTFENDLVNALAEGKSPDLVMIPQSMLVAQRAKLLAIPYENLPVRTFKDTYIDGAEIFMMSDGVYGIPFAVDPLVMYWNRDIFTSSGLAAPPKTWEALVAQTTNAITRTNDRREITQSAVALGEYSNITHAKDILAMLFLQAGSSMVTEQNKEYKVTFNVSQANSLGTGDAVLSFYTQFSLPSRDLYSWNRSKASDRTEFLGGTLALYFGKGSEYGSLARENPNLNFDIAPVPQGSDATILRTYGDFYAFAIPRGSKNKDYAYIFARDMSTGKGGTELATKLNFVPVLRSVLGEGTGDPVASVRYNAALIARAWLDPKPQETERLFGRMVDEIVSNNGAQTGGIVSATLYKLEQLF